MTLLIDMRSAGAELAPLSYDTLRRYFYGRRRGAGHDFFAGMGGMAAAIILAGGEVLLSANHSTSAVLTHNVNFDHVEHVIGDISVLDPSNLPKGANVGCFSPECRLHSNANNWREAIAELSPYDPKRESERSRCTMWCPQRMAAYHQYDYVVIENVVEVCKWNQFRNGNWLKGWADLGYEVDQVCFNAAMFGAPQSRDRIAFVCRRIGAPQPNLDFRPRCYCPTCESDVFAIQTWNAKSVDWMRTAVGPVGKYGDQYQYTCPSCRTICSPFILPARLAINPAIKGTRIGDREKLGMLPLTENTMARLRQGWAHRGRVSRTLDIVAPDGSRGTLPAWLPATGHAPGGEMIVPERRNAKGRHTNSEPAQSVCSGGNHHALIGANRKGDIPRSSDGNPTTTMTGQGSHYVVGVLQEGAVARDALLDPIATLTAGGNHFILGANRTNNVPRDGNREPAAPVVTAHGGGLFAVQPTNGDMLVQVAGHTYERPGSDYIRAWSLDAVSPTQSTSRDRGVLQQPDQGIIAGAGANDSSRSTGCDPSPTQVAGRGQSLVVPAGTNGKLRDADREPGATQVSTVRGMLLEGDEAFLASYYGTAGAIRAASAEPGGTQTTKDRHAVLVPAGGTWQQQTPDADLNPSPTRVPNDSYGVSSGTDDIPLEDCYFRMLHAKEAQALQDLVVRPDGQPYLTIEIEVKPGKQMTGETAVRLIGNAVPQTMFANVYHRVFCASEGTLVHAPGDTRWRYLHPKSRRRQ